MTFKNELSQEYDNVQMEEVSEKIGELLKHVVASAAREMVAKETIRVSKDLLLEDEISFKSFEAFLQREGIAFKYSHALGAYVLDLTA